MDWEHYTHSDPSVMLGKPVVRGTRLTVAFILDLFAGGWSEQDVIDNYPRLNRESIRAVFALAAECLRANTLFPTPAPVGS